MKVRCLASSITCCLTLMCCSIAVLAQKKIVQLVVETTITAPPPANAGKDVVTIVESIPSITIESGKQAIIQIGKLEYAITPTLLDDGTVEIASTVTQGDDKKADKLIVPTIKGKLGNVAEIRIGQQTLTIKISLAK